MNETIRELMLANKESSEASRLASELDGIQSIVEPLVSVIRQAEEIPEEVQEQCTELMEMLAEVRIKAHKKAQIMSESYAALLEKYLEKSELAERDENMKLVFKEV